jgi:hypothetical protein
MDFYRSTIGYDTVRFDGFQSFNDRLRYGTIRLFSIVNDIERQVKFDIVPIVLIKRVALLLPKKSRSRAKIALRHFALRSVSTWCT